jgi:hypothetical protein
MKRTEHYTQHLIGPAHLIVVRRDGGRDLWTVEENYRGRAVPLTGLFTRRDQADLLADAYAATRRAHITSNGAAA